MEKGEAIADQLGQLYAFMIQQIDLAVASKSCKLLGEVKGILNNIKGAWEGLKKHDTAGTSADAVETEVQPVEEEGSTENPVPRSSTANQRLTLSA
jgi:flagellin-specific chaperone FliS